MGSFLIVITDLITIPSSVSRGLLLNYWIV